MKNQKVIIFGIVAILLVLVGGYFLFFSKKPQVEEPVTSSEEQIASLDPQEIGLSLATTSDGRKVILEISETEGIESLDYELSYTAKGDIPRGVIGHIEVKNPGKNIMQEIVLGTCSDVCHYDEDVSDIKVVLKVAKTDGKIYQVEKSL